MTGDLWRTGLVFVPGFMQRGEAWEGVASALGQSYRRLCLDPITWTWPERLGELRDAASPGDVVVGYSMGGRLALHAALADPGRYAAVITVGSSAGIEDPAERQERRRDDEELAAWMERRPIEEVVARWEALPAFATQHAGLVEAQRPGRLSHDPAALARLLRSAGQGALAPVWGRLAGLRSPLVAFAGERDPAYADAARRMARLVPRGEAAVVPRAGHAAHLERPEPFAALLAEALERLAREPAAG